MQNCIFLEGTRLQGEIQGHGGPTEKHEALEQEGLGLQSWGWSCQGAKLRRENTKPEKCLGSSSYKDEAGYHCGLQMQSQRWARGRRLVPRKSVYKSWSISRGLEGDMQPQAQ